MESSSSGFTRPPEWSDEERMYYLLAPCPPSATPSLSDSKITFWRAIIISSSKEMKKLVFNEQELCERFRWQGTAPKCLRLVIECMERNKDAQKLSSYEDTDGAGTIGWLRWGVSVMTRPISWTWRWYWGSAGTASQQSNASEDYVLVSVVKELSQLVLKTQQSSVVHSSTDCVMKCSDYEQLCDKLAYPGCADLVKSQLLEDGKLTRTTTPDGTEVLKFSTKNERVKPLFDVDLGILRIKDTIESLTREIAHLSSRSQNLRRQAVQQYKLNHNTEAVRLLKTAKMMEGPLRKREVMLENLQTVLVQIQMAETDAKIMEAYRSGAAALKAMRDEVPLEQAEQVMEELKELTEDGAQLAQVLGEDLATMEDLVDEDELERELISLIGGDKPATAPVPVFRETIPVQENTPCNVVTEDSHKISKRKLLLA